MGEAKKRGIAAVQETLEALGVEALGGRVQVRWNQREAATPFGQMAYFAEFLNLTGLYRRWIESAPLHYASPNGSKIADVLGTLFLSVLSGHWRYAHIAALRADAVSAAVLGMNAVVSEDTVRRALSAMEEAAGQTLLFCSGEDGGRNLVNSLGCLWAINYWADLTLDRVALRQSRISLGDA
jgi:hypothetical protein